MGCGIVSKITDPENPNFLPPKDIALLEASWPDIEASGPEKVGAIAFKNLFKVAPDTFKMFHSFCDDPKWETSRHYMHHCRVVVALIGSIVCTLKKPELIKRHLSTLGFRHAMRDEPATPEHFRILGEEFLKALEEVLGPKWNPELRDAWGKLYTALSNGIQEEMQASAV